VRFSLLGSEEYREGLLVDLGGGGLCLETCAPLRTGVVVHIEVVDLDVDAAGLGGTRSFRGTVRWTRDLGHREQTRYGIGVQYVRPITH